MAELVYNVTEAAEALGISRRSMYKLIHKEGFPTLTVGGRRLISRELLARWVRERAGGQENFKHERQSRTKIKGAKRGQM